MLSLVVNESIFALYQRGYDSGMSEDFEIIDTVSNTDTFEVRCRRTDGGGSHYQEPYGTYLMFKEA